jgi:hypothetical protein
LVLGGTEKKRTQEEHFIRGVTTKEEKKESKQNSS